MALTQQRPPGILSGRRYGSFTARGVPPSGPHPVVLLTQQRPPGVVGGRRYGSFSGKAQITYTLAVLPGVFSSSFASVENDYELDVLPGSFSITGQPAEFTFVNFTPAVPGALAPRRKNLLLTYSPKRRPN